MFQVPNDPEPQIKVRQRRKDGAMWLGVTALLLIALFWTLGLLGVIIGVFGSLCWGIFLWNQTAR